MPAEPLSSLDASFLYLERPATHMHVAGVSVFEPRNGVPLGYEDVERVVGGRLHLAPRLRQRLLTVPGGLARPRWVDDDRFDLDFHLRRAAVPSPGGRLQLEQTVGRVLSSPLDRGRPLWELHVLEGLVASRTAVLLKLHHALADGISGVAIASALFDLEPDATPGSPRPWSPERAPRTAELVREAVADLFVHPAEALLEAVGDPRHAAAAAGQVLAGMRAFLGMGATPAGPFDTAIGPNRRFATAESPFEDFRRVRQALGGTVNDVALAVVAGGLHDLLRERGEPVRGRTLRVLMPVSVRPTNQNGSTGNRVAPAIIDVPVGPMAPARRLGRVRAATSALKRSGMAERASAIIGLGTFAPPALQAMTARIVSRGRWFNLVVSNVPAPQVPLYLAGSRLAASYPALPLGANCGLSIGCTSLGGTMAFGLTADSDSVRGLDVLARGIERSIAELVELAGRSPGRLSPAARRANRRPPPTIDREPPSGARARGR